MKEEEGSQIREEENGQFIERVSCFRQSPKGKVSPRVKTDIFGAVAQSLGAMANSSGGTVLLGAASEEEVRGVFWDERDRRLFINLLREAFVPPVLFEVVCQEVLGKTLLRFTVSPSPAIHTQKNGETHLRVGAQNISLSRERLAALREARTETWHEREILPRSSWADLDSDLVEEFISHLGLRGGAEKTLHRPYGLVEYKENRPVLTRAAVYLFGRDPLRWHPRPGIEFVRFEGTEEKSREGYNVAERTRIEGPLLRLVREAEKSIGERIREQVLQRDLFFREKFELPSFVWREALTNALAHRDYSLEGSGISVWMFDDRIEIRSPGRLPRTVKADQILRRQKVHYARNPLITRVLTDAGYMQARGEGLPRVFREMDRHGLNPPDWREEANGCCLVFRNTPVLDEAALVWLKQVNQVSLNPRQKRILAYARVHGGIFSSSDYQKFGVDRDGAYVEIKTLVRLGLVEPVKKHGKVYRVREVQEEKTDLAWLPWVLGPLKAKGYFTLKELELPASISRKKAWTLIRNLAKEGYFSPSGRGRTTRYHLTEKLKPYLEKMDFPVSFPPEGERAEN
jgi:ATP-dependent DNA helicase RecG